MITIIIIGYIPTFISLLIAIIFYKKLHPKWLQLFCFFLLFSLAIEVGSTLYSHYFKKSNHFIINIYMPISFIFYFFIFYKTFEAKSRTIIYASLIIYFLFFLYDILFDDGLYYFNTLSFCVGAILIILLCLIYFMQLFTSEKLLNYFALPMFWISTGLLFFFVGSLVQMSLMKYMIEKNLDPDGRIYQCIIITLNVLLYGSLSMSFICNNLWKRVS